MQKMASLHSDMVLQKTPMPSIYKIAIETDISILSNVSVSITSSMYLCNVLQLLALLASENFDLGIDRDVRLDTSIGVVLVT